LTATNQNRDYQFNFKQLKIITMKIIITTIIGSFLF